MASLLPLRDRWIPSPGSPEAATFPTGIDGLDSLLKGGLPRGKITEISGSHSCGKTSLCFSVLLRTTREGALTAYIDAFDTLAPEFAEQVGINLKRLLWIRCNGTPGERFQMAMKASDFLTQGGGFEVIVLDIAPSQPFPERALQQMSASAWFRLQRNLKGSSTVFLVLSQRKAAGNASSMALLLQRSRSYWGAEKRDELSRKPHFEGIQIQASLIRGQSHGSVTLHSRF